MKITKSKLQQIVKEEIANVLADVIIPLPVTSSPAGLKPKAASKEMDHVASTWQDALEHCTDAHPDDEFERGVCMNKYVREAGLYADKPAPDYDALRKNVIK